MFNDAIKFALHFGGRPQYRTAWPPRPASRPPGQIALSDQARQNFVNPVFRDRDREFVQDLLRGRARIIRATEALRHEAVYRQRKKRGHPLFIIIFMQPINELLWEKYGLGIEKTKMTLG